MNVVIERLMSHIRSDRLRFEATIHFEVAIRLEAIIHFIDNGNIMKAMVKRD